jgi:hypothetical protein
MSANAFDRTPRGSDTDTDLTADGVRDLAEELRAYAATAPAARPGLADRVFAAVDVELAERTPGIAAIAVVPFRARLNLGFRPASLRSLLAAAALVAVLSAGVAFAAAGGLPFDMPQLWAPEQAPPVQSDTQQPADPGDDDAQGPADEDADTSPDPSEDADDDQDVDEDSGDEDSDEDADEDQDEDSGDGDEDSGDEDSDEDSGDEDSDEDSGDSDEDSGDSDEDSTEGEGGSDDESDESDVNGDLAPSDESDDDDAAEAGDSEES